MVVAAAMMIFLVAVLVLLFVALILVAVFRSKAGSQDSGGPLLEGMARARAAREAAEAAELLLPVTSCRMLVAPDYPFSRFARDVGGLDMTPTAPITSSEPEAVTWKDRTFTVQYFYNARVGLRAVEISGHGEAKYLRNDLLNLCYVPSLEGYKVSEHLSSTDPQTCLLGILAAEWIGVGADHRYYLEGVGKLCNHPDPEVAEQAQRVHAFLASQAQTSRG